MVKNEKKPTEVGVYPRVPEEPAGWLEVELPEFVMTKLQSYIEVAEKNPTSYNSELAGHISKSLLMKDEDDWFFKTVLSAMIMGFHRTFPLFNVSFLTEEAPYCLNTFWVNFQKENEFNPIHSHSGVFSFVIWVKIPTDWREQHALPISANSNAPIASDFIFSHTTMLGEFKQTTYTLDKSSEGRMLFFPAKLKHAVQPFYNCDEERISISGNICVDISENSMKQFRSQMKEKDDQK